MAVKNQMPLEWSYNIIYHFLCLLKNPASLRSTFAVSGEFRPLMKNCCKALAMWLTPKKFPWLLFLSLFFLQLTSSRATAAQGWWVGSDGEQASGVEVVSFFHLRPILTLSLLGCRQHVPPGQAGKCTPSPLARTADRSWTAKRSWVLLRGTRQGPAAAEVGAVLQADIRQDWSELPTFHPRHK